VSELRAAFAALGVTAPGWEDRPQQLEMAEAVLAALNDEHPLLVEAGTGTGKTLAYLVPAALSGKRIVISTATKTLQEQLLHKDIPLLRRIRDVSAVVLKGVSNYVCRRRYSETGDTDDPDLVRISDWVGRTANGDRAELHDVPEDAPAWRLVTTTPEGRLGPKCPFFERCYVTQARRAAAKADIIIVNHHLYFVDAALRAQFPGAQVLPDHDAVIFDEAHALEEIATEHFGVGVSTHRMAALLRDGDRALGAIALLANLEARGETVFAGIRARLGARLHDGDEARVTAPEDLFERDAWFQLDAALEELHAHAAQKPGDEPAEAVARRADAFRGDLATVAEGASRRHVVWAEVRGRAVAVHASPVEVASLFQERVLPNVTSAVFTSATLTADHRFDYVRGRLGLDPALTGELRLESPFDWSRQALVYLPRDLPAPDDPAFGDAADARVVELLDVTRGRAFVLTTSWRSLRRAATALRGRVPYPVLVQGERPRAALLDAFRANVGSVLLATASFWEGVDVPGEALSLVVLEKLPFAPPDDPITAARVRRLEETGQDPFQTYQLPRAALALKQGFGRLIRRGDDRGIVAVLDHRILTRSYGRTFLATLPPAPRTSALEQVRRWWEGV
jgi:ATP-dependent DNA helicase DinG